MLNRTVRTLSAANSGLNLGTRSTAANAVVVNGKTLRNRPNLLLLFGMHDHPMRDGIIDFKGKPWSMIPGSPSSASVRPSLGFSWPARGVAVAEAPEAEPRVVETDPRCPAIRRQRQAVTGQNRPDQAKRRSPRKTWSYRRPESDLRSSSPTARRILAAPTGLALG